MQFTDLTTPTLLRVLMFCAATLVGASVSASAAHAITIQEVKSKGGITAWLVEEHAIPLIAMSFSFEGGSAADPADKPGLAHFLSGMLDEGAGELDFNAFQTREDDLAMKLSFDTGLDSFSGSLQTLTPNRAGAFDLLRLALTKPRFDAAPLEKVRRQILLSVKGDSEDPEAIAGDVWMHAAFGAHPYSRDDKGTVEAVATVTGERPARPQPALVRPPGPQDRGGRRHRRRRVGGGARPGVRRIAGDAPRCPRSPRPRSSMGRW